MKRGFDIFFSLAILLIFFPIFLFLFLVVRLTSKGSAFYFSERVGKEGKKIICTKFRTMKIGAEYSLENLLKNTQYSKEWNQYHKLKKDPRITKVGYFLRKTSLDELPQFFDVLRGDLSIVGPRPLSFFEIKKYSGPKIDTMLKVRPGITGLSQTQGRNHLSIEERIELEQSYVQKQNFLIDLLIIVKTIPQIITCKGAY
jgi:exopolysaccharide production protein ExoY